MIAREFPFTAAESEDISAALRTYHAKISSRGNKPWYKHVDLRRVLTSILGGDSMSALVDGYLVVYDIGETWYSPHKVLEEVMVIRIYPGGDFLQVPKFLESKAKAHGCAMVCVGTALARSDAALIKIYERSGYQVAAVQLTKTIL